MQRAQLGGESAVGPCREGTASYIRSFPLAECGDTPGRNPLPGNPSPSPGVHAKRKWHHIFDQQQDR
eukprot:11611412-Alexandrium_andersonii.AAC.1